MCGVLRIIENSCAGTRGQKNGFCMRNGWIDVARFFFAWLVVVIHVPMHGGLYLLPLARCAVPFFFVTAGFFCYSDDEMKFQNNLKKNFKKWILLWLKYSCCLFFLSIMLNTFLGVDVFFSFKDVARFVLEGSCSMNDVVCFNEKIYGINTLWFLYSGSLAFAFFYLLRYVMFRRLFVALIICLFLISTKLNYYENTVPRFFSLGIPFVFMGICLRKYQFSPKKIFAFVSFLLLFVVVSYIEFFINLKMCGRHDIQCFWSAPFLIASLFCVLLFLQKMFPINKRVPAILTLDVYVWHRLVWLVFVIAGVSQFMMGLDAVVVYVATLILAFVLRAASSKIRRNYGTSR